MLVQRTVRITDNNIRKAIAHYIERGGIIYCTHCPIAQNYKGRRVKDVHVSVEWVKAGTHTRTDSPLSWEEPIYRHKAKLSKDAIAFARAYDTYVGTGDWENYKTPTVEGFKAYLKANNIKRTFKVLHEGEENG